MYFIYFIYLDYLYLKNTLWVIVLSLFCILSYGGIPVLKADTHVYIRPRVGVGL